MVSFNEEHAGEEIKDGLVDDEHVDFLSTAVAGAQQRQHDEAVRHRSNWSYHVRDRIHDARVTVARPAEHRTFAASAVYRRVRHVLRLDPRWRDFRVSYCVVFCVTIRWLQGGIRRFPVSNVSHELQ